LSSEKIRNLILVAGHAVPHRFDRLDHDDGWYLKHFQAGEGRFYVEHVKAGVELAAADPSALLVFAGGQSDTNAGPRSEGQGYWLIAEYFGWFGHPEVRGRATTEEFSLDSFLNVLYGVCRFREYTGHYPDFYTASGWKFKGERFDIHRKAIRWPVERFRYVGVNDPPRLAENLPFEAARREIFRGDPYGWSEEPATKRDARNAQRRQHGYAESCLELKNLLAWHGPEAFDGPLPW